MDYDGETVLPLFYHTPESQHSKIDSLVISTSFYF